MPLSFTTDDADNIPSETEFDDSEEEQNFKLSRGKNPSLKMKAEAKEVVSKCAKCSIINCGSTKSFHCALYPLPSKSQRKKEWIDAIGSFQAQIPEDFKICQHHFDVEDFKITVNDFSMYRNILKINAVPKFSGKVSSSYCSLYNPMQNTFLQIKPS